MARSLLLALYLLLLLCGHDGLCADRAVRRTEVDRIALSQVGVREVGRNDGPRVRAYQRAVGAPARSEWCAAFVSWVLQRAGVTSALRNGWAAAWFPQARTIWSRAGGQRVEPRPGDVIGYAFNPRQPEHINHVGLVHRWGSGAAVETIEGNTNAAGARTGNGVWMKWRLKSQVKAVSCWIDDD